MADARKMLAHITMQDGEVFNPIGTVAGYRVLQRLLTDMLERIERLEEQG